MKPCKYLDYESDYRDCKLCTCAPHYPDVRYWRRGEIWTHENGEQVNPRDVQFCKKRGRITGIFQCYNEGEMSCYEAQEATE